MDDSDQVDSGDTDSLETIIGGKIPPPSSTSSTIGPYKLLTKLGEGGMGVVWMAEQNEPVRRRVALKVIRSAFGDRHTIARFEAERQALAMMNHPNISTILDSGVAETGQPYFVMELVEGMPITKFCDKHQLSVKQRLELLLQVCRAVQHAHQKGIIHRDLKPSNILVREQDDSPIPKVIDFGLAKAVQNQSKLTDKTLFTEFGHVMGTLQYMSPEQADLDQMDIDTRTDVYALGVIAYELLTGSTPLRSETVREEAMLNLLERVKTDEAPRPSQRIADSGDRLTMLAVDRKEEPRRLVSSLESELDWIVLKAIDKDRSRRYSTANDMAADIERFLEDEPVEARPPSPLYRIRKFTRRHRIAIATGAAFALLMIVATASSLAFALWAMDEAEKATRASDKAQAATTAAFLAAEKEREASRKALEAAEKERTAKAKLESGFRLGFALIEARFSGESPDILLNALLEIDAQEKNPIADDRINARINVFEASISMLRLLETSKSETLLARMAAIANIQSLERDFRRADRLLNEAIELDGDLGIAYLIRAQLNAEAYSTIQRLSKNVPGVAPLDARRIDSDWDMAVKLMPRSSYAYSGRGRWKYRIDETDQAIKDLRRAEELNPENDFALAGLSRIAFSRQEYREAVDLALRAHRVSARTGDIFFGESFDDTLQKDIAIITFNKLWNKDAPFLDQIYPAAIVHLFGKDVDDLDVAIGYVWKRVIQFLETNEPSAWAELVDELERIDFPEEDAGFHATRKLFLALASAAEGNELAAKLLCDDSFPKQDRTWRGELEREAVNSLKKLVAQHFDAADGAAKTIEQLLDRILASAQ